MKTKMLEIGIVSLAALCNLPGLLAMPDQRAEFRDEIRQEMRDQTRQELREDRQKEQHVDRVTTGHKTEQLQLGKDIIDVHGNRVRLEQYLLKAGNKHPETDAILTANQLGILAITKREEIGRLDYGFMLQTWKLPISRLGDVAQMHHAMWGGSPTPPANWLTNMNMLIANGLRSDPNRDVATWDMTYGDPTLVTMRGSDFSGGFQAQQERKVYVPSSTEFVFKINGTIVDHFGSSYNNQTWSFSSTAQDAKTLVSIDSQKPSGDDKMHFQNTRTYSDGTKVTEDHWMIDNAGKIIALTFSGTIGDKSVQSAKITSDVNFEMRLKSNLLKRADIDVLFAPEMLTDQENSSQSGEKIQPR